MNKEMLILGYQNRINLLKHRGKENRNIIRKLQRKIRALENS